MSSPIADAARGPRLMRRIVPWSVLPLTVIANAAASVPWLRAFPSSVLAAPLFGAAILSVLVPWVAVRLGVRQLWRTALIDVMAFAGYCLLVVLREPTGTNDLIHGLVRGPAEILSFALPLVSPRTLLVAPVALCWLTGAVAGECAARRWFTVVPHCGWLIAFGLSYAATVRAAVGNARDVGVYDTALAAELLVALLLLRVAQSWVRQDRAAEATQPDALLPLRGLVVGIATTALVAVIAAATTQTSPFAKQPAAPQRIPTVNSSQPLTPLSFIAGLRPSDPRSTGTPVFSVSVNRRSPAYFGVANVDYYDGDAWSFTRTFRPSGGVVPADTDPTLNAGGQLVTQRYRIIGPTLPSAPWMPFLDRAQQVTGIAINVDTATGMIVPAGGLSNGGSYTVVSNAALPTFATVGTAALPATSTPPIDTQLPGSLRVTLSGLVTSFTEKTGISSAQPVPFLQALLDDLRTNYALAGATPAPTAAAPTSPAPTAKASRTPKPSARAKASPTPAAASVPPHTGGTGFSDVLASVLGPQRAATPEQYATLFALVARQLGVPARVVTGFRVRPLGRATTLAPGRYDVSTAQAWTWVEIPIRGSGWVVADPSPGRYGASGSQQRVGTQPSPPASAPPSQNALFTQSDGGHAVAPKSTVPHPRAASPMPLVIGVLIAIGVLLVLVPLLLLLRKRLRLRRRRHEPDARLRVLAAWHEGLDVLAESGLPESTALTSSEVAAATATQFGPESGAHAAFLGQAADLVIYSSTAAVGPADAERAWISQIELRRLVRRQLPLRTRLAANLRYHRSGDVARRRRSGAEGPGRRLH